MNGKKFAAAVALSCGVPLLAQAVSLNPKGLGEVLVYPYYSANANKTTLISITNTTAHGKAVKLRFHEGYDGRDVLDFNAYLTPYGTWTGSVVANGSGPDAPASIVTGDDASCTVPAFTPSPGNAAMKSLDFTDASYAGANTADGPTGQSDGGPVTLDRTREGHFDVIEMGEVINGSHGSLDAITEAANCAQIIGAWAAGGYWNTDATADLSPPTGGLYGEAAIIDVAQGTLYPMAPAAIEGFSSTVQHSAPDSAAPDLDTASANASGVVSAFVPYQGRMLQLDYRNPIDAISALFMTDTLYNDFSTDASIGARSDWIVTAPTKRFYVDPKYVGKTAKPPFERAFEQGYSVGTIYRPDGTIIRQFASAFPYACVTTDPHAYSRDGDDYEIGHNGPDGFETSPGLDPCLETSVLPFSVDSNDLPLSALGSQLTNAGDPTNDTLTVFDIGGVPFSNGSLQLSFVHDGRAYDFGTPNPLHHELGAATNGDVLTGEPVIGFLASSYVNGNVTRGVLSNYSAAYAHRATATCTHAGGGC